MEGLTATAFAASRLRGCSGFAHLPSFPLEVFCPEPVRADALVHDVREEVTGSVHLDGDFSSSQRDVDGEAAVGGEAFNLVRHAHPRERLADVPVQLGDGDPSLTRLLPHPLRVALQFARDHLAVGTRRVERERGLIYLHEIDAREPFGEGLVRQSSPVRIRELGARPRRERRPTPERVGDALRKERVHVPQARGVQRLEQPRVRVHAQVSVREHDVGHALIGELVYASRDDVVEHGEEIIPGSVLERAERPYEVREHVRGGGALLLRHAKPPHARLLEATHRRRPGQVLELRQRVHHVRDGLHEQILVGEFQQSPAHHRERVLPGVFLQGVKRPQEVRHLHDVVRRPVSGPAAA